MKRFKTFWILSLSQIFILLLNLILISFIIHKSFTDFYIKEIEKKLLTEANLIEPQISEFISLNNLSDLQKSVWDLGKKTSSRITVVLLNGKVIADNQANLDRLDNHLERPEIKAASNGQIGRSIRFSDTLNTETNYLAIPIKKNNKLLGVLRLSHSIKDLEIPLKEVFSRFFIQSFLIILILIFIIGFYSKYLTISLEKISSITENFLKGKYSERVKISRWDTSEISNFGKSLNKMSEVIEDQISKILKQKKEQEIVFSSMAEGVLTIDNNKNVYHINNSAKKIFNLDIEKEFKGVPLREVIRSKKVEDLYDEIISTKIFQHSELVLNENQIFQVSGSILSDEKEDIFGALLVFNNISEIRKLEQHRKDFVGNLSHELKTPLTSINGYLENIIDGTVDSPEDQTRFLKVVQKQALRLQKIIDDLFILSQVENEKGDNFSAEVMEISPILSATKSLFNEQKPNILIDCDKNLTAKVNSHLLEIAIGNLLQNAIRYGKKDSPIILGAKSINGEIEISVKNEGPCIPIEHHRRLFERFYSIDKSRSREFGGSGLGLSIVKHIALAHKGSVAIKSAPGEGCTFSIFLPKI